MTGAAAGGGRTPEIVGSEKPFFDAVRCKTPAELEALFAAELGPDA